ncbi:conjugative transposon protein TraN [Chryseolinea soli]|uniref:Conjugative transposon protein TraN n=1 Tax=Chryseolinea soli TaxID=2321403 RepID=A0A385SPV9_9BACT|nr:conjugative transposon protein TraN [Chryseolinea soli]AYB31995.1 conjugative transposon protein TraN [Chryseolinea soli]
MLLKLKCLVTTVLLNTILLYSFAQPLVEVSSNKTSTIVFPASITTVDRGSRDVLAQKAKGVDNVLHLKAARVNFKETNLTVITTDGTLHVFMIRYSDKPGTLTVNAHGNTPSESPASPIQFVSEMTSSELKSHVENILNNPSGHSMKGASHFDMRLALQDIYIEGNTLFFHLKLANNSNIPFHTDVLRFYVKDKKKPKRTATQEVSQMPIYHYGNAFVINGKSTEELVYALPKFTIPDAKMLTIELMEKNGGRHLHLKIKNKSLLKAQPIPVD